MTFSKKGRDLTESELKTFDVRIWSSPKVLSDRFDISQAEVLSLKQARRPDVRWQDV